MRRKVTEIYHTNRRCCSVCVDACPVDAITVNDVAKVDGDKCVDCGACVACVAECPCEAITLENEGM